MLIYKDILPPDFPNAIAEIFGIQKEQYQDRKIEPEKSVLFSIKETNSEVKNIEVKKEPPE